MAIDSKYCPLPIDLVLRHGNQFPFDLFINIAGEKLIKISHKDAEIAEALERYREKGLDKVYAVESEYQDFIKTAQKKLKEKLREKRIKMLSAGKLKLMSDYHEFVKDQFDCQQVSEDTLEMAKEITRGTLAAISQSVNIFKMYNSFKNNCPEEYMVSMLISYICTGICEQFNWESKEVKHKISLAAFLCDITLPKKDFKILYNNYDNPKILPETIKKHPQKVSAILMNNKQLASMETIRIINEHHEKPDGSGFPYGYEGSTRVSKLSAVFIVAQDYVQELRRHEYDHKNTGQILNLLEIRYNAGSYLKAFTALKKFITKETQVYTDL